MYIVKQSSTLGVNLTNLKIGRSVVTMHFSKTNLKNVIGGCNSENKKPTTYTQQKSLKFNWKPFFDLTSPAKKPKS